MLYVQAIDTNPIVYGVLPSCFTAQLLEIMTSTGVSLDPVYTLKGVRGMLAEMGANPTRFQGRRVLYIHTGKGRHVTRTPFAYHILLPPCMRVQLCQSECYCNHCNSSSTCGTLMCAEFMARRLNPIIHVKSITPSCSSQRTWLYGMDRFCRLWT